MIPRKYYTRDQNPKTQEEAMRAIYWFTFGYGICLVIWLPGVILSNAWPIIGEVSNPRIGWLNLTFGFAVLPLVVLLLASFIQALSDSEIQRGRNHELSL